MGQVRSAIDRYEMIREGDRIAVGVSGGKDSMVLLAALARIREYYPARFEVCAVTADPCFGNVETNYTPVTEFCESIGVEHIIRRTQLGKIIFEDRKEKNPCSLCARMRRGILHNMAKEAGCNSIALGHHFDDAVETFVMNLFHGGRLECYAPKSYLSRKDLCLIRPLSFCTEDEIIRIVKKLDIPVVKSKCPVDGDTCRQEIKMLLRRLECEYPALRSKVFGAMQHGHLNGW